MMIRLFAGALCPLWGALSLPLSRQHWVTWLLSRLAVYLTAGAVAAVLFILWAALWATFARADDPFADPPKKGWHARQMQPDQPTFSCCGPADAYEADNIEVIDGRFYAIVTDAREDAPLGRPHIAMGTRIEIPSHKFNDPRPDPNPSGHGVVFVNTVGDVFCYFNPPADG